MAGKKTSKNIKFEEALAELESVVDKLQNGDLPLEDAIEEFQRGTELSKICLEKLNAAKAAVQKLVVDPDNEDDYHTEEFADLEEENITASDRED
ncbi:MAG: exodeoxyribonuclease VII small subunit [Acidaminococcaceae bacterium]|jgi:exodeoxyribonuclease VII small subunit|nr:exodeoxyribonuclease VII small subunit [Acidaminococcaceae bacterium]MBO6182095.1 exodeoxyribonuclease VII small subunit [Acidaminococcaceae bacterium]MBO6264584.1 exodeoxyribonuclease VII small subunit [Acidaminococcaceae bacterium]MBP3264444.1 exodeoxyribonuclease VII small subunit [Acidaminococcaceae bacterium]MBQ5344073.1 exodeoxyribonuclease VII small subunit [Acidaminococcaceae bacterium]